ncbi:nucleoside/nucleotide kinase family protein [Paraoerskovia sediminicola]|uniref:Nucleoside/nucleotide kinase family protein n=1 Tax=Paraoerskovia sediminicola TaxID=1138587 RepID=A0ABM8FZN3_9CELL|nr:nucleoside/nucleotide kinase family protein [Paraoerskovia sediminicola]BDZ41157.1 nucleoside/nucleotide kinase family protein [Paraoerskovia sediminicola]
MTSERANPGLAMNPVVLEGAAASPAALAARVARLVDVAAGRRVVVGLAGAPGAGKSTLATAVAKAIEAIRPIEATEAGPDGPAPRVVVLPMDGFHLADEELARLGRGDRKGAPDTFDAEGYVALLRRVRDGRGPVYAPEFRREIEAAVAGAIRVDPDVQVVLTEGNYLLADSDDLTDDLTDDLPDDVADDGPEPGAVPGRWTPVRSLLDETWFVEPPEDLRVRRLVARHVAHGRRESEARAWALGPDERNARLVAATRDRADVVLHPA